MKILIFEDEIYNYHLLAHMLEELEPGCEVVGPITTVEHGREYLALHSNADIIIADVQLSDGLSFDALKNVPENIPIIFTTAYEEYALRAFEYNSLSYLLKPIGEEELSIALKKAKRLMAPAEDNSRRIDKELLRKLINEEVYRERFIVKTRKGERVVSVSNIRYIVSENKTTYIRLLDGTSFPIDISLDRMSDQLNPKSFMKVNRKYIVPIEQVESMETITNGKELLHLKGAAAPDIIISRDRKAEVKAWIAMV